MVLRINYWTEVDAVNVVAAVRVNDCKPANGVAGFVIDVKVFFVEGRNLTRLIRALGEDAQQVLNIGVENEKKNKGLYESKRASPGGPDAQHH
ncbi:hypothetical protein EZV62_026823 [Acer yangbiense]|uniref:Uncharacterized protein n=1 Tax=Acer yangbiense TaxID=1000413 RepID=A0A5C7GSS7_9ROSI|nr:hypothetical protein EZV62_026823 [Acer yangbiense]